MLTPYHTTNRTATTNGPISLAGAASLGKCGYGNGIAVMERISGTVLITTICTCQTFIYYVNWLKTNFEVIFKTHFRAKKNSKIIMDP